MSRAWLVVLLLASASACADTEETVRESAVYFGTGATPTAAAPPVLRRLTARQYDNTVRDLLGVQEVPSADFVADGEVGGFTSNASAPAVPVVVEQYERAAGLLAEAADLKHVLPCDPKGTGEGPCAVSFVESFGRRAFRRPLTPTERTRYVDLYLKATIELGRSFEGGIRLVIRAMLQSPHFLYLVERGGPPGAGSSAAPLSGFEVATRLSYFLVAAGPDETLLNAAAAGYLDNRFGIEQQARRLLADPRARVALSEFFVEWLGLIRLGALGQCQEHFPAFTPEMPAILLGELRRFVEWVLFDSDARFATLMTSAHAFLDEPMAWLYHHDGVTGSVPQEVDLNHKRRAGVLTRGAWLAVHAHPEITSPVHRGRFVRERLLCQRVGSPPGELVIAPLVFDPTLTQRERLAEHTQNPSCAGCHQLMDPIGFVFEGYDAIGRWRTEDDTGAPVDTSGELIGTADADGPLDGALALIDRLADSRQVHRCFATQWLRFALGRTEAPEDQASLASIDQAFADSGLDIRELIVGLTVTDSFRYRRLPAAGGAP